MLQSRCFSIAGRCLVVLWLLASIGCESATRERAADLRVERSREIASARLAQDSGDAPKPQETVPSKMVGPTDTQPAALAADIFAQLHDPVDLPAALDRELEAELAKIESNPRLTRELKDARKTETKDTHTRRLPEILRRLQAIRRPARVTLTLADAVRRTLQNNYAIRIQSYNPAVETARIVEAEAQFDAVFFANLTNDKKNQPTASQLEATDTQFFQFESGVRKLLSVGTQVQVSYALDRTEMDIFFQQLNPAYSNLFTVEFRQPFLRGFGLDFNRAQIEISKLDREMSVERLRRDIREVLFNVEQAYWRLLQARRAIAISSQLISDLEIAYELVQARAKYDMLPVQISMVGSRLEQRKAEFVEICNNVRNAEDALKRLMNDPEFNLSMDVEILPADVPSVEAVILDQVGEVTSALAYRSELREAKLTIEQAQIAIGVAKNRALPKLDVAFRYVVDGLGANADRAFSQLSENDFHEYVIMLELEWPIGNRGPEAALRAARLKQAQAIMAHRDAIENVIMECQEAVRGILSNYDQIGPNFRATTTSEEWVKANKARQISLDPQSLQLELDSYEGLGGARQQLLDKVVNYNIALSNLERRKGTLLEYNNIVIRGPDDPSRIQPYRAFGP